jgi:hypothetical protein
MLQQAGSLRSLLQQAGPTAEGVCQTLGCCSGRAAVVCARELAPPAGSGAVAGARSRQYYSVAIHHTGPAVYQGAGRAHSR